MKAYRHLPGGKKASRRKNEPASNSVKSSNGGSKKFQMEVLESRMLLSDTPLPMVALDGVVEPNAFPEAPLVLFDGGATSASSPVSPVSKEGQLLDLAYNAASGEMFLANNSVIDRLDLSTNALLGSFDIPGSDFTGALGLQILPWAVASLGGTAVNAGSLLVTNGTSASASIFAVDSLTGEIKASLNLGSEFDAVAGAFDPIRGTLFILDASNDRILEVNPADGSIVNGFAAPFAIGAGGLAINPDTGNLWIGSDQSGSLAEVTAEGSLVRLIDVTAVGIGSEISGLAFNGSDLLISSTRGDTFRIHDPAVNISQSISGTAGTTITVPVNISDTAGLESIDIGNFSAGMPGITYDTNILDATSASVRAGSVLPAGTTLVANVNDATGTIYVAIAFSSPPVLPSGSIILIDFQAKATATGTTRIDLRNVSLNEGGLIVSPGPAAGVDATDGIISFGVVTVNQPPVVNAATFSLPENRANGTAVGTVTATDPDAGTVLTYAITGGNTGGAFAINAATGAITVAASSALNFEITPSFSLTVTATDNGTPALSGGNTITVNLTNVNEAPVVNAATFSLAESSANGTAVGTVTASDPDAGTVLTYSIAGGNTGGAFAINTTTGAITVATSSVLNFETTPSFSLTVTATDNGTPVLFGSNTITINLTNLNEAPVVNAATFSLAENSANGTAVGTVTATDPDAGTALTYAITGGNTGGAFAINAATGAITVAASAALNFETTPSFSLTVTATDNGTPVLIGSNTITVNLTNVNEAPVVNDQTFTVASNAANGAVVGTVLATDPDAGTVLTYSITSGNTGGAFALNGTTGQLTVANAAALTGTSFSVNVSVSDNGAPTLSDTAVITINVTNVNQAPVVNDQTFVVAENSANGTTVGTIVATDPDGSQTRTISVTGGSGQTAFAVSAAGVITVANSALLNFETTPSFTLNVTVTDNGTPQLSDTAVITLNLTNVNETPVVNAATFSLAENSANGTAVGTVTATDPDAGTVLTYSITGGNTGGAFAINAATGAITVAASAALNFETTPSFNLTVRATDNGTPSLNASNTITINLTNVNEAPTVNAATFSLAENSANGTAVGTVTATDPDAGTALTYAITGGNTGGAFAINAATGVITVAASAALNFETTPSFSLTVTATDNGTPVLSGSNTITVNLTNVNEAPVVNAATFSLAENSANGTAVGTVTATDPDAGTVLIYSITGGNTGGAFAINAATGAITVASSAALNFETTPSFSLTVTATDNGTPVLVGSNTITVNLTNVNEAPTVIAATFSLVENSANGTAVGTVTATDPDAGTALTYAITGGNTGGAFAINAATGAITVAASAALNFETTPSFSLTVTATDNGTPVLIGSNTITVNLTNVNEAPVVNDQTFTVASNAANGAVVGTVLATDPDAGTVLTYSITSGNTGGAFALNGTTGQLTVANAAALTGTSFSVNVSVSDNGAPTLSDTAVITINVTNVNQAPVVNDQTFVVAENSANGTTVGTIVATDPDGSQTRTISVTGGSGQTAFAVSAAGVITVANSALLNFETTPSFTLNVTVTDNGTPQLSDTAVITLNLTNVNETPVVNAATFSLAENSANGTAVGTVTATDPDAGTVLTYSITGGNTGGAFAINAATGAITVAASAALNFETTPSFNLTVRATDNGTPSLNASNTITINLTNVNEAPTVNAATFSLAENSANGTAVGTVTATDPDAGTALTYAITGGNTGGAFAINAATGAITVATSSALNFETTPSFSLTVTATDNGTPVLFGSNTITINLTNLNEAPVVNAATFSLAENSANGTAVGTVTATDPDAGTALTYAITGGNTGGAFAINAATGAITVAASAALNFETTPSFSLTVTATDNGTPVLIGSNTITVNLTNVNEAPVVNDQTFTVASNAANGAVVGTVLATDPDAGTVLTYSITSGNTGGAFALNGTTGQLTVANAAALTGTSFSVNVSVSDNGAPTLSDTAVITINVTNVNQAPVVNDQTFVVAENSANGTTVGTIVATDPDGSQTRTISVTGGSGQTAFAVSAAGVITVANSALLNFETTPSFTLNVTVTDNGTPQLSDTAVITLNLTNVNETPVVNAATFSLAENSANGTAVGTVTATDPDAGTVLTYSITGGNTGGAFAINAATGAITVAASAALNFETTPSFNLTVRATDNGTPSLNASNTITINLTNVNEAPTVNAATFSLAENSANGTAVGTVTATDPDAGTALTYAITGGNTGGAFAINAATGVITVAASAALNFETTPSFSLTVTATDNGTPVLSGSNTITVNLTNVNEAPVVNAATFSLAENSANGTAVGTVTATDPDAGTVLIYSITGGNTGGAFAINAATGAITVASSAALNFETTPSFSLTVTATDNGTPVLVGSNTITVNLTNVNEAPTVIAATFSLVENSANGTAVGTVTATDPDAGTALTYAITGGNTGGAFAINAATGAITVAASAALNFETTPSFSLTVTATDNGTPVLIGSNTITVNLTNVNEAPVVNDQTFTVASNAANGAVVGTVLATDPDAGTVLTYSITSGNTGGAFALNGTTGQLTVANAAALTGTSFSVNVSVSDNGAPTLSDTAVITINVTNVNQAPVVNDQTFVVAENSANGTTVGTIVATDPDGSQTRTISVTGGSGQTAFAVSAAGVITVANSALLNFETTPSFTLNVTVTDNGTPQLSDTAVITLNLTNVNETPVVNAATFSLAENSANGTAVGTVTATDPDAGTVLTYSITGGNTGGAFAINAATGAITVASSAALNFETTPSFSLTVRATDNGTPSLNASNTITINLTNVNEAPLATNDSYTTNQGVALNVAAPGVLGNDTDVDGNTLTAVLVAGPTSGSLTLNPNGSFTYTPTAGYSGSDSFTYRASDGLTTSSIATVAITVNAIASAPVVTAPAAITITATSAGGATALTSQQLAAFLLSGSAVDPNDPAPVRLTPQINGVDVTPSTQFALGATTVTFRFRNAAGLIGTATSSVNVVVGTVSISNSITGKGVDASGNYYVDLQLTNTGNGNAVNLAITEASFRTLTGSGSVSLLNPGAITVGYLQAGASTTIRILLNRPVTVKRFSFTQTMTFNDVTGASFSSSASQAVIP